jgi:PGF-pre-PGF domain-containing protein
MCARLKMERIYLSKVALIITLVTLLLSSFAPALVSTQIYKPTLPTPEVLLTLTGASFSVPKTLKDDVSSYRKSIPRDVLEKLSIALPSEAFILAVPEGLYLVFSEQSDKGLATVYGWELPSIQLTGIKLSVVVAKSVKFEKEGVPTSISNLIAHPSDYKFKLVKIDANRRQISILYDPDEPPYIEFPITIGYLVEKPVEPLDIISRIVDRARDFVLKADEQFIKDFIGIKGVERIWVFNLEYEYWYDSPTITNGIVIPTNHPIFDLIERSMPYIGKFARLEEVVLYDVKTDLLFEGVSSVSELKSNYGKYLGKVVKFTANSYGGYISIQEVIEHNTPCTENDVYIQNVGCVNIVVDARLEGLVSWNELSVPPKREELLLTAGVSSFHQDELFMNASGKFEFIGRLVSTKQVSESLPEGFALVIYSAKKIGEIEFGKLAMEAREKIQSNVGELHYALQDLYPYERKPNISYKVPAKIFKPKAPIFVDTPREIPEICVEKNFTINIDVVAPEAPVSINITNSHISNISIKLKDVAKNVTISFEKIFSKPLEIPEPPGVVYAYNEINVSVSKDLLEGGEVTFWVLKEWLIANKAGAEKVVMLRYQGKWMELPTKFVSENATHLKFIAETPSFSTFAIAIKIAEVSPTSAEPVTTPTAPTPPILTPTPPPTPAPCFEVILAILGLLTIAYLLRRS